MPAPAETVRVKVCGVTNVADALACRAIGVDWVGLNFHPASVRFVTESQAAEVVGALDAAATAVGVFVDRSAAEIARIAGVLGLEVVQLHGAEPRELVRELQSSAGLRVVKAFGIADASDVTSAIEWLDRARDAGPASEPFAVLLDARSGKRSGGTGMRISGNQIHMFIDRWNVNPSLPAVRLIIAGGLSPANVSECVREFRPWMVDVASGVESAPGVKSEAQIREFVSRARHA